MELPRAGAPAGGDRMIFATLSDYIDLTALWKIGVVVLLASVLVPVAFSVGIVGEARREDAADARGDAA